MVILSSDEARLSLRTVPTRGWILVLRHLFPSKFKLREVCDFHDSSVLALRQRAGGTVQWRLSKCILLDLSIVYMHMWIISRCPGGAVNCFPCESKYFFSLLFHPSALCLSPAGETFWIFSSMEGKERKGGGCWGAGGSGSQRLLVGG